MSMMDKQKEMNNSNSELKAIHQFGKVRDFVLSLIFIILLYFFFHSSFFRLEVHGMSMEPTLYPGDRILALKHFDIQYGDIVVVPEKQSSVLLIKRIIGLPGDFIKVQNGNVYRNNQLLEEKYIVNSFLDTTSDGEWHVDVGQTFLMGDNRDQSIDSRIYGTFSIFDIQGKYLFKYLDNNLMATIHNWIIKIQVQH